MGFAQLMLYPGTDFAKFDKSTNQRLSEQAANDKIEAGVVVVIVGRVIGIRALHIPYENDQ